MGKFVFVYEGGAGPEDMSQEDVAKVMKAWEDWYGTLSVSDPGNPFGQTKSVGPDGSVTTGSSLTGYTIVDAADIDAAVAQAKAGPHLEAGGTIVVAETVDM